MRTYFIPTILLLFVLLSALVSWMAKNVEGIEQTPLLIGNLALGLISFLAYTLIRNSLKKENPNALLRARVSVTMLKFFACIALLLIYIFVFKATKDQKHTIFAFLGMYIIYSLVESIHLSKLAKGRTGTHSAPQKNGQAKKEI